MALPCCSNINVQQPKDMDPPSTVREVQNKSETETSSPSVPVISFPFQSSTVSGHMPPKPAPRSIMTAEKVIMHTPRFCVIKIDKNVINDNVVYNNSPSQYLCVSVYAGKDFIVPTPRAAMSWSHSDKHFCCWRGRSHLCENTKCRYTKDHAIIFIYIFFTSTYLHSLHIIIERKLGLKYINCAAYALRRSNCQS